MISRIFRSLICVASVLAPYSSAFGADAFKFGELVVRYAKSEGASAQALEQFEMKQVKPLSQRTALISISNAEVGAAAADDVAPYLAACDRLKSAGVTDKCSPNYRLHLLEQPTDPNYSELYGMMNISAPAAWNISTGSSEVIVGIHDSGIDYTHPDLIANMWTNPHEIADNGLDDDNDGYIDDVHGINAITGTGNPFDDNSHGTHVAGTIGAVGNNGVGVTGVNWTVRLMGLKFLDSDGVGYVSDSITALVYARTHGVKVINASWGGSSFSDTLEAEIQSLEDAGILFVAAAGNSADDIDLNPTYPANFNVASMITVAAVDDQDQLASFSNYGAQTVDIAAPGVSILSTVPGNGYDYYDGTSMATPHVSGLAALLLSITPGLSPTQLRNAIVDSGDSISGLIGSVSSAKRINAYSAALVASGLNPDPVTSAPDFTMQIGSYSSRDATFMPRARITNKGRISVMMSGGSESESMSLKLSVRGVTCEVKDFSLEPEGATAFMLSAIPGLKGKATFKLYDHSNALAASASATFMPSRSAKTFLSYGSAAKLCRTLARRVH